MSLEAMVWALYDVQLDAQVDPLAKLVLIAIADQAGRDGTGAIASRAYLAEATGLSETTVGQRVRRLRQAGLIRPGDPDLTAAERYRSAVWDLDVPARFRVRPRKTPGRGSQGGREGVARGSRWRRHTHCTHHTNRTPRERCPFGPARSRGRGARSHAPSAPRGPARHARGDQVHQRGGNRLNH